MRKTNQFQLVMNGLKQSRGRLKIVARESGVAYTTVKNIASGISVDPRISNIQKLADYFVRQSA